MEINLRTSWTCNVCRHTEIMLLLQAPASSAACAECSSSENDPLLGEASHRASSPAALWLQLRSGLMSLNMSPKVQRVQKHVLTLRPGSPYCSFYFDILLPGVSASCLLVIMFVHRTQRLQKDHVWEQRVVNVCWSSVWSSLRLTDELQMLLSAFSAADWVKHWPAGLDSSLLLTFSCFLVLNICSACYLLFVGAPR